MATTTQYCVRQDIIDRLSQTGILHVSDDDAKETVGETELRRSVDPAISAAAGEIDAALIPWIEVPLSQNEDDLNQWLRDRAIDLASEYIAARKGGKVPESFGKAAERSREWLKEAREGKLRVPGLVYPTDAFDLQLRVMGKPRVMNPRPTRSKLERALKQ